MTESNPRRSGEASVMRYNCNLYAAMLVIEGKWKCTILCMLCKYGPLRFTDLQRRIGAASPRMISKQLKELEADGMLIRNASTTGRIRVEYSVTPKARSLMPVLQALAEWGAMYQTVRVVVPSDAPPTLRRSSAHYFYALRDGEAWRTGSRL